VVAPPRRGDIVWLDFDPGAGHEQSGRRPAVTVSPLSYNVRVGLGLFCPVTRTAKGYPFEVALPDAMGFTGVILADQLKSLDWRARHAVVAASIPAETLAELLAKIRTLTA